MLQFIVRRLILLIPVLIGILLVTFVIVRAIPGDPCKAMLGEKATAEKCDEFRERYGLNDNIMVQFGRYMVNMAQGDLGTSIRFSRPVVDIIAERLPLTIELTIVAMIFSTVVGVCLGIISALRRNTLIDTFTMMIANIGVSMPVFWLGLMLAYVFALTLKGYAVFPAAFRAVDLRVIALSPWRKYGVLQNPAGSKNSCSIFLSNSLLFNSIVTGNWKHAMGWAAAPDPARRSQSAPFPCRSSPA